MPREGGDGEIGRGETLLEGKRAAIGRPMGGEGVGAIGP